MKIKIFVEDWEETRPLAQTQTINTWWKLLLYKWLFRTYITLNNTLFNTNIPAKLNVMQKLALFFIAPDVLEKDSLNDNDDDDLNF